VHARPVETQAIGFFLILKFFFEESRVQTIIDQHVPLDPRKINLTHGQASVAMVGYSKNTGKISSNLSGRYLLAMIQPFPYSNKLTVAIPPM
jgi:hypothetical protein